MNKIIVAIVCVVVFFAGLNLYISSKRDKNHSDAGLAMQLSERIDRLEQQLEIEKSQRQALENTLAELNETLLSGDFLTDNDSVTSISASLNSPTAETENSESTQTNRREEFRQRMQARNDPTRRVSRFEEAGFSSDQASWIVQAEREMQFDNLDQRWERQHQEYLENPERFDLSANNPIREELGDQDYEKYLQANGRSTSVRINRVLQESPAAYAGLRIGDQILRYNGQRVFNFRELNTVSVAGEKGSPVIIDVMRNGSVVQLTVERGPMGITSRRGRR